MYEHEMVDEHDGRWAGWSMSAMVNEHRLMSMVVNEHDGRCARWSMSMMFDEHDGW